MSFQYGGQWYNNVQVGKAYDTQADADAEEGARSKRTQNQQAGDGEALGEVIAILFKLALISLPLGLLLLAGWDCWALVHTTSSGDWCMHTTSSTGTSCVFPSLQYLSGRLVQYLGMHTVYWMYPFIHTITTAILFGVTFILGVPGYFASHFYVKGHGLLGLQTAADVVRLILMILTYIGTLILTVIFTQFIVALATAPIARPIIQWVVHKVNPDYKVSYKLTVLVIMGWFFFRHRIHRIIDQYLGGPA